MKVEDGTLEEALRLDLGVEKDHPIFIPAVTIKKGHRTSTVYLLEGYVFVASGLIPETRYFRLEDKPYVEQIIATKSGQYNLRTLSVVSNSEVEGLRLQLRDVLGSDVEVGDIVHVIDGVYKGLDGVVEGKDSDLAFVCFSLRSIKVLTGIPLAFVDLVQDDDSLEIPITKTAQQYGYVVWASHLDTTIKTFMPESTVDLWLGNDHLGLKNVDFKRRRVYLGRGKVLPSAKSFVLQKKPRGGVSVCFK